MAHDQHDEEYIRSHAWEYPGEAWLGIESMRAPKRAQEGGWKLESWDDLRGTMTGSRKTIQGGGRRRYR
jgi:hypothetical protein